MAEKLVGPFIPIQLPATNEEQPAEDGPEGPNGKTERTDEDGRGGRNFTEIAQEHHKGRFANADAGYADREGGEGVDDGSHREHVEKRGRRSCRLESASGKVIAESIAKVRRKGGCENDQGAPSAELEMASMENFPEPGAMARRNGKEPAQENGNGHPSSPETENQQCEIGQCAGGGRLMQPVEAPTDHGDSYGDQADQSEYSLSYDHEDGIDFLFGKAPAEIGGPERVSSDQAWEQSVEENSDEQNARTAPSGHLETKMAQQKMPANGAEKFDEAVDQEGGGEPFPIGQTQGGEKFLLQIAVAEQPIDEATANGDLEEDLSELFTAD